MKRRQYNLQKGGRHFQRSIFERRLTQTIFKRRPYNFQKLLGPSSKDGQTILKRQLIHRQRTIFEKAADQFSKGDNTIYKRWSTFSTKHFWTAFESFSKGDNIIFKRRPNYFIKTALRAATPSLAAKPFSKGGTSCH